jgi:hypothetical protein
MGQPFVIDLKKYPSYNNQDPLTMFLLKAGM